MIRFFKTYLVLLAFSIGAVGNAQAQTEEELAAFARKAQDPLGNVKALMTDNTVAFNGGTHDSTTYGFQLQPVPGESATQLFRCSFHQNLTPPENRVWDRRSRWIPVHRSVLPVRVGDMV
jgi:hypothetical protein